MPSGALPDEIIKEILTPALRVPDENFRSTDSVSPFLTSTESSSALLLVCKSWLRVATPLLYHVVVLRSKPQARSLCCTLRANGVLATFIKKLRVEGGFGASMHHVLRLGKNIEELWLKLVIWSGDSVTGLCNGLPLTNPRRLILPDEGSNGNAPTQIIHVSRANNSGSNSLSSWTRARTKEVLSDEKLEKLMHYEFMDLDDDMG
ncbi:hypothetical protein C0992_011818 [Termitomyces sp. T32_za158]|nr:hypothetical protein C0992_011818 [Termitomyces sp. T32_za158]